MPETPGSGQKDPIGSSENEPFNAGKLPFSALKEASELAERTFRVTEKGVESALGEPVLTLRETKGIWRIGQIDSPQYTNGLRNRVAARLHNAIMMGRNVDLVAKLLQSGSPHLEEMVSALKSVLQKFEQEDGFRLVD